MQIENFVVITVKSNSCRNCVDIDLPCVKCLNFGNRIAFNYKPDLNRIDETIRRTGTCDYQLILVNPTS